MVGYGKLNTDGTLRSCSEQLDGMVPLSNFDTDKNGKYYGFYKFSPSKDKYIADTLKIQFELDEIFLEDIKETKTKALDELIITHNTVAYDANGKAIGNMAAVMGIANFKYNQLVSLGVLDDVTGDYVPMTPLETYTFVYKTSKIWWKGADDNPHEVMIESVCEALEKSMLEVASIIGV